MNYTIGAVTIAVCFLMASITLDREKVQKCKYLRSRLPEEQTECVGLSSKRIRLTSVLIALTAAVTVWRLTETVHDTLNFIKMTSTLAILTGCACVDAVEYRIPNFFTGLLAFLAAAFLAMGFLTGTEGASGYLRSSVFAAGTSAIVLSVGSMLSHQGIGVGDIKLIAALGMMGGVYITGGTLFFAITLCALYAGWLLMAKKKTMKESVPFGPFLFLGYMLTVCLLEF